MRKYTEQEVLALIREGKSLGLDTMGFKNPEELEEAIEVLKQADELLWTRRQSQYEERRIKFAAAYMAGASLRQLATLASISAPSMREKIRRAGVGSDILQKIGAMRVGKPPEFNFGQVAAMLAHFDRHRVEYASKSPFFLAPILRNIALEEDRDETMYAVQPSPSDEAPGVH